MERKLTKINIITRPSKLEDLKDALNKIGVLLHTGKFGDGKIFVYELSDAIRICTGHRGVEAIMDIPDEKAE